MNSSMKLSISPTKSKGKQNSSLGQLHSKMLLKRDACCAKSLRKKRHPHERFITIKPLIKNDRNITTHLSRVVGVCSVKSLKCPKLHLSKISKTVGKAKNVE